jgi:hypothetical protein
LSRVLAGRFRELRPQHDSARRFVSKCALTSITIPDPAPPREPGTREPASGHRTAP